MAAIDVLFNRAKRQLEELETLVNKLQEECNNSISSATGASLSASFGSMSTTLKDLEQFLKRDISQKDLHRG